MAQNNLNTSFMIGATEEEYKWLKKAISYNYEDDNGVCDEDGSVFRSVTGLDDFISSSLESFPQFSMSAVSDKVARSYRSDLSPKYEYNVLVYGDEDVDLEHIADVLRGLLVKFRPKESIGFTYAEWCSRPRPGEFSGGLVFVTADNVEWGNASTELQMLVRSFKDRVEEGD
jgi:hypothetical protein